MDVVAFNRLNDYFPLLKLGLYGKTRTLIRECRGILERAKRIVGQQVVFSALAAVEGAQGHYGQAIPFAETALHFAYLSGRILSCADSHYKLSDYLQYAGNEIRISLAHRLAAGMIYLQIGPGMIDSNWHVQGPDLLRVIANLTSDFALSTPHLLPLRTSFDEVCHIVEAVKGVRFRELFDSLPRRFSSGDEALSEILRMTSSCYSDYSESTQRSSTASKRDYH